MATIYIQKQLEIGVDVTPSLVLKSVPYFSREDKIEIIMEILLFDEMIRNNIQNMIESMNEIEETNNYKP